MARERTLAFPGPGFPDLDDGVVGARHDAQRVPLQRPDALDVAKGRPHAAASRRVPEAQRVVEPGCEDVARRKRPGGLRDEGGPVGRGRVRLLLLLG